MTSLTAQLTEIVGKAFAAAGLPAELGRVTVADRTDLAQFQCNGALVAAKAAKKNPRAVAEEIVALLKSRPEFSKIEIAGPGFINLSVTDEFLAAQLDAAARDTHFGVAPVAAQTVVLDYGGPNVAKAMHVGHLRAALIGDALRRIMAFAGYRTLGDVHLGDWGTPMGMIMSEYIDSGRAENLLATNLADPQAVASLMDELEKLYPQVAAACKDDAGRRERALDATVRLQNKEDEYYRLWQIIHDVSIISIRRNYEALDVHFDLWKGEADVHDLIAPMVADLRARHFAVMDDGALIVPVKKNDDTKEIPPLILYKRDGAVMYGTTDLATIVERINLYQPAKIIYVVDQRQHLHFEQVFRAARLSGIAPEAVELTHAGFGTMNGTDGKPFKTRAGGVMKLEDLIAMGLEKARARLAEAELAQGMEAAALNDVAHKVALAAIKFADLQNQRQSDYVFDLDRLTSFEGKTGPYLLYQAVRIQSLLKKAGAVDANAALVIQEADRPLALLLAEFPEAFELALRHYAPHYLCDYAYRLAQGFSSFYAACHILSEENAALRASRLRLCAVTAQLLTTVLGLLGISVPEQM